MQKDLFARTINGKSTEICSTRHCGVNFIGFGNDWEFGLNTSLPVIFLLLRKFLLSLLLEETTDSRRTVRRT